MVPAGTYQELGQTGPRAREIPAPPDPAGAVFAAPRENASTHPERQ